jgi:tRNA(Ile)-lysidine synthase
MHKFVRNLLTEWRRLGLPFSDKTFVIAVSGGADSVALTLALDDLKQRKKLDLRFIIAHFNHNLRGIESEKDAAFVKQLAEKLKIEFTHKIQSRQSKIQDQKGNLEQTARLARYQFLGEIAQKFGADAILTAHTQNDQAETILLNLIRGSGLNGLSGMKTIRDIEIASRSFNQAKSENPNPKSQIQLIRPLLNFAQREETENLCLENKIEFRLDAMNNDLKFSRVRVRKEIIPLLKKLNPNIIETLSMTANLLQEEVQELEKCELEITESLTQNKLKSLSKSMRLRSLRSWLKQHRGNLRQLDLKHLEAVDRLISSPKSGREIELPGGEKVIKKQGKLVFEKTGVEKS